MTIEELFTQRFVEMEEKIKKLEDKNEALQGELRKEKERADKAEAIIGALQPIVCHSETTGSTFIKIKNDYLFQNDKDRDALYKEILPYATEEGSDNG